MSYLSDEDQCWRCNICNKLIDNIWEAVLAHFRLYHPGKIVKDNVS